MKIKKLSLLCTVLVFLFSNVYSEERAETVNPDEEIKKYEIRGVLDMGTPSVSIYYEGKSLGWTKSGQKRGSCLFKAYDKATKEIVLEISGKEYRLREGISGVSENDPKIQSLQTIHNRASRVFDKNNDGVLDRSEIELMINAANSSSVEDKDSSIFQIADIDENGILGESERIQMREYLLIKLYDVSPDADLDKDGKVTLEESQKYFMSKNPPNY